MDKRNKYRSLEDLGCQSSVLIASNPEDRSKEPPISAEAK